MTPRPLTSVFLDIIRPSTATVTSGSMEDRLGRVDWQEFCSLLYWSGLAPLGYSRLRKYVGLMPDGIHAWLQAQYYETVGRNLLMLKEFEKVSAGFTRAGITALLLKGPALAFFCFGLEMRSFYDLDLLVKPQDLALADEVLRSLEYKVADDASHPYHRRYVWMGSVLPKVVEVHFDLTDRSRSISVDVAGVWDRSVTVEMFGQVARVPDLTDHLLLLMMQLPHHRWAPRLLADIGQFLHRWSGVIDWPGFGSRARSWGMRAVAGSALYLAGSLLGVDLPPGARDFMKPESYFRRVQWNVVLQTAWEQLGSARSGISWVAPYVVLDRGLRAPALLLRRTLGMGSDWAKDQRSLGATQRVLVGALSAPRLLAILVRSVAPVNHYASSGSGGPSLA